MQKVKKSVSVENCVRIVTSEGMCLFFKFVEDEMFRSLLNAVDSNGVRKILLPVRENPCQCYSHSVELKKENIESFLQTADAFIRKSIQRSCVLRLLELESVLYLRFVRGMRIL